MRLANRDNSPLSERIAYGFDITVLWVTTGTRKDNFAFSRDNSLLSEWIAKVVVITVFSVTERILSVFVREAKAL